MILHQKRLYFCLLVAALVLSLSFKSEDWGFFGHKRINRLAVFTLPPEMMSFYKQNIEFLTEHSVDPDKRRYATKHEAPRHFIDLDRYGDFPFQNLPRNWADALAKYTNIYLIYPSDTVLLFDARQTAFSQKYIAFRSEAIRNIAKKDSFGIDRNVYRQFVFNNILNQYYEDKWVVSADSLQFLFKNSQIDLDVSKVQGVIAKENFSEHGILPYHLAQMQRRLTQAFKDKNGEHILRLSAEIGHYIGDAHVPLHTTQNYNGQLTEQIGIHAFWESRIPELFADESYDFFVGAPQYVEETNDYFWNMVFESHRLVGDVLRIEKDLSKTFSSEKQFCFEERLGVLTRTQCREYAEAYQTQLKNTIETRMRAAIISVASAWYTAWVDAGQPDLSQLSADTKKNKTDESLDADFSKGKILGREHEN